MRVKNLIRNLLLPLESAKWFFFAAVFFRFILELSYREFVVPIYGYSGYFLDVNTPKYFESWILYIVLIIVFPKRLNKASDYLMVYLLFSFLAPLLVLYGLSDASREHLYIVLLAVVLIAVFRVGRPYKIPIIQRGRTLAYLIVGLSVLGVTVWLFISGGIRYINFNLLLVYDFRTEVGEAISRGFMGYLNIWAFKVFGPLLLAISLWKKNYLLAAIAIGLHVLWFGISSHKSVLFFPLLIISLWAWFRHTKALALIPIGMAAAVSISLIIFFVLDYIFLGTMFIRRVFFVPPILTFTYFEFFSENQFVYWSNSILSSYIQYPYDLGPARLIGAYRGTYSAANNTFLSTGYMHAGVPGMIVYGVLAGLLFRLIDSVCYKGVPPWVAVAAVIVPAQSLINNADLPTALLTHGIGIAIVILFLLRSAVDVPSHTHKLSPRVGRPLSSSEASRPPYLDFH